MHLRQITLKYYGGQNRSSTISNRLRKDLKDMDSENKDVEKNSKSENGMTADIRIRKTQVYIYKLVFPYFIFYFTDIHLQESYFFSPLFFEKNISSANFYA